MPTINWFEKDGEYENELDLLHDIIEIGLTIYDESKKTMKLC